MQAIARVNRVFKDKEGGLVVDYVGIAAALKRAMNDYTARDKKRGARAQALPYLVVIQPVDTSIISFFDKIKSCFFNSSMGRF